MDLHFVPAPVSSCDSGFTLTYLLQLSNLLLNKVKISKIRQIVSENIHICIIANVALSWHDNLQFLNP